jgi:predicted negative regulator of RcsB-dependent stress response
MKWKVSNTLFVVAVVIFALGVLFNWMQVKNSVESSLEKARRIKKEKAEAKRKQQEEKVEDEINEEIIEIINNTDNGEK